MAEAFNRLLQAVRLQRDAFVWMDFNDRATGDALIFIGITRVLLLLGFGGSILGVATDFGRLEGFFLSLINAVIFWLVYAGLAYAIARFMLQAGGNYAVFLRMTGFAYPTLLLVIFTFRLGLPAVPALALGAVWFLAVVTAGITYESDLPTERALIASVGAFVAWIIVASIFGRGYI